MLTSDGFLNHGTDGGGNGAPGNHSDEYEGTDDEDDYEDDDDEDGGDDHGGNNRRRIGLGRRPPPFLTTVTPYPPVYRTLNYLEFSYRHLIPLRYILIV